MQKLLIQGGYPLQGEITISGAKNAALPLLCASLLTTDTIELSNVPELMDIVTMLSLLQQMGVVTRRKDHSKIELSTKDVSNPTAPYEMVKTMRAAILVLGPLVARVGEAHISLPGGCAIGLRPVDQHIKGLQAMGRKLRSNMVISVLKQVNSKVPAFSWIS